MKSENSFYFIDKCIHFVQYSPFDTFSTYSYITWSCMTEFSVEQKSLKTMSDASFAKIIRPFDGLWGHNCSTFFFSLSIYTFICRRDRPAQTSPPTNDADDDVWHCGLRNDIRSVGFPVLGGVGRQGVLDGQDGVAVGVDQWTEAGEFGVKFQIVFHAMTQNLRLPRPAYIMGSTILLLSCHHLSTWHRMVMLHRYWVAITLTRRGMIGKVVPGLGPVHFPEGFPVYVGQ
jgi:hypothetical protein